VAALLGLTVIATVMLRGQIPGADPAPRDRASESSAGPVGIVTLLAVSMIVLAAALVFSLRNPPGARPARRELPRSAGGQGGSRTRRYLLLAVGLALAWILAFVLLNQLTAGPADVGPPPRIDGPDPAPGVVVPTESRGRGVGGVFGYLIATTVGFAVMVVLGAVLAARRPRPAPAGTSFALARTEAAPQPDPLAAAAERGLAEVGNPSREPRAAIIACYAAMERRLAGSPDAAPQDSDTPSEVLDRAVRHRAVPAQSATTLVELFSEARFSSHVMTEADREAAEHALRAVVAALRAPDLSAAP